MTIPIDLLNMPRITLPQVKPEQWITRKGKQFMAVLPPCPKIKPVQIRKLFGVSQEIMANSIGMTCRNWQALERENKPLSAQYVWACLALYILTDNPTAIVGTPQTILEKFKRDLKGV